MNTFDIVDESKLKRTTKKIVELAKSVRQKNVVYFAIGYSELVCTHWEGRCATLYLIDRLNRVWIDLLVESTIEPPIRTPDYGFGVFCGTVQDDESITLTTVSIMSPDEWDEMLREMASTDQEPFSISVANEVANSLNTHPTETVQYEVFLELMNLWHKEEISRLRMYQYGSRMVYGARRKDIRIAYVSEEKIPGRLPDGKMVSTLYIDPPRDQYGNTFLDLAVPVVHKDPLPDGPDEQLIIFLPEFDEYDSKMTSMTVMFTTEMDYSEGGYYYQPGNTFNHIVQRKPEVFRKKRMWAIRIRKVLSYDKDQYLLFEPYDPAGRCYILNFDGAKVFGHHDRGKYLCAYTIQGEQVYEWVKRDEFLKEVSEE